MLSGMGHRPREGIMDLPELWTGTSGHVLLEPWVPPDIRGGLAELIAELEAAAPEGLASKRTAFREGGRTDKGSPKLMELSAAERQTVALSHLLNDRFELLVGAQLVRAGALTRMRKDTPDFDCRWGEHEFGIEATTRARQEAAAALEQVMERGLWDGPDVTVTLTRSGKLLFSKSPEVIAGISDRVVAGIKERIAHAAEQPQSGSVPVPELGLTAMWHAGMGISMPGMRVTYESPLAFTEEEWDHHWKMVALQVQDTIKKKGGKPYSLPSIAVVDVSRLGETSRLLSPEGISKYQGVIDNCDLGNLRGVLLVRTTLTSRVIEPLCWRLEESVRLAAGAVILGEHGKSLVGS
jgi:hypothetical protein